MRVGECVFLFDPRWDSFSTLMRDWCHFYRGLCIQTPGGSRTFSHGLYERLPPTPVPASLNPITNPHQPIPLVTVQRSASRPIYIHICYCLSCSSLGMNQRMYENGQKYLDIWHPVLLFTSCRDCFVHFFFDYWLWFTSLSSCKFDV